jgi:hypothetical protein
MNYFVEMPIPPGSLSSLNVGQGGSREPRASLFRDAPYRTDLTLFFELPPLYELSFRLPTNQAAHIAFGAAHITHALSASTDPAISAVAAVCSPHDPKESVCCKTALPLSPATNALLIPKRTFLAKIFVL